MFLKLKTFLLAILIGFVFAGTGFEASFAGDSIDIDLGGTKNPTPLSSTALATPEQTKTTLSSLSAQKVESQATTKSEKAVLTKIVLSPKDQNLLLTLSGSNISDPQISRNTDGKIIIKLINTRLNIKQSIKTDNSILSAIRSSDHNGTAWVVLDNHGLGNWTWAKQKNDIVVNFSTSSLKNAQTEKLATIATPITPSLSSSSTLEALSSDSKNSARLIEATVKPFENGIKFIMTSDGPSKYVVRKLSQPEKLIIHFLNTRLEVNEKDKKYKNDDSELKKGGLVSFQIGEEGVLLGFVETMNFIDKQVSVRSRRN